jgi:hypothetical protein
MEEDYPDVFEVLETQKTTNIGSHDFCIGGNSISKYYTLISEYIRKHN